MKRNLKLFSALALSLLVSCGSQGGSSVSKVESSTSTESSISSVQSKVESSESVSSVEVSSAEVSSEETSVESASSEELSSEVSSSQEVSSEESTVIPPGPGSSEDKPVEAENEAKLNVSDLATGDIAEDTVIGKYKIYANNDGETKKCMTVEALSSEESADGLTFTKRLKSQSASSTAADKVARVIEFTATGKGTIDIYAKSGSATDLTREIGIYNVEKAVQHSKATCGADTAKLTLEFHYAGTYYITTNNNVSIYALSATWQDGVNEDWEPTMQLKDNNILNVAELPAQTYTKDLAVGNFVIKATAEKDQSVVIDANSKKYEGTSYTQRLKLGGAGTADYRSVVINVETAARITVLALSSSSSATRHAKLVNSATGADVDTYEVPGAVTGDSSTTLSASVTAVEPGSYYYTATDGGVNVYCISIEA